MSSSAPPAHIGGYAILCELRAGGMGQIYMAHRLGAHGFEKLVALKTIRADLCADDDYRRMFLDEARVLARVDHPAVAQVSDFGEDGDQLYLAMEYVAGVSLGELLGARGGPLPVRVALELVAQVCRGLHVAHEVTDLTGRNMNIVHRDVKPRNVLLSFGGNPKLIDFGIALSRDRATPRTEHGRLKGTPGYMAPEQFRGQTVDRRTDIFAAGVVLHEALTGHRLFQGDSLYDTGTQVCSGRVEPPSRHNPAVTPAVDAAVLTSLAQAPSDRFHTAAEMAGALEGLVGMLEGDSLAAFTDRELAAARARHQAFLREVTATPDAARRGRSAGVATARFAADSPADQRSKTTAVAGAGPDQTTATASRVSPASTIRQRGLTPAPRRRRVWLGAATAGIAITIGVWLTVGRSDGEALAPTPATPPAIRPTTIDETAALPVPTLEATASPSRDGGAPASPPPGATTSSGSAGRTSADGGAPTRRDRPGRTKTPASRRRNSRASTANSAAPLPGTLTILATPYAVVYIDGQSHGPTPLYGIKQPAGDHAIELRRPDDDSRRWRTKLTLAPGSHRKIRAPDEP